MKAEQKSSGSTPGQTSGAALERKLHQLNVAKLANELNMLSAIFVNTAGNLIAIGNAYRVQGSNFRILQTFNNMEQNSSGDMSGEVREEDDSQRVMQLQRFEKQEKMMKNAYALQQELDKLMKQMERVEKFLEEKRGQGLE